MQLETTSASRPAQAPAGPSPAGRRRAIDLPPDDGPLELETTAPARRAGPSAGRAARRPPAEVAEESRSRSARPPPRAALELELDRRPARDRRDRGADRAHAVGGAAASASARAGDRRLPLAAEPAARALGAAASAVPTRWWPASWWPSPTRWRCPGAPRRRRRPTSPSSSTSRGRCASVSRRPRGPTPSSCAPRRSPRALAAGAGELSLDDELAAAEPELPSVALPPRSSPSASSLPPGLRPKRSESVEPPRASPSRLWLPPQAAASDGRAGPDGAAAACSLSAAPLAGAHHPRRAAHQSGAQPRGLQPLRRGGGGPARRAAARAAAAAARPDARDLHRARAARATRSSTRSRPPPRAPRRRRGPRRSRRRMEAPDEGKPEPGALPKIPLFSDLPRGRLHRALRAVPAAPLRAGRARHRAGQPVGDSFFVICSGTGARVPHGRRRAPRPGHAGGGHLLRRDGAAVRRAAHRLGGGGRRRHAAAGDLRRHAQGAVREAPHAWPRR